MTQNVLHLLLAERSDYIPDDEQILQFIEDLHPDFVDRDCWAIRTPGADGLMAYAGACSMEHEYLAEEMETLGTDIALIAEPRDDAALRALVPGSEGERTEAGLSIVRATDFLIPPHTEHLRYPLPRCSGGCGRPLKCTRVSVASECGHCGTACDLTEQNWSLYDYWDGSLRNTHRSLLTRFAIVYDCSTDAPPLVESGYPNLISDARFLAAAEKLCGGALWQFPVMVGEEMLA
jgi:hypothetical protein